jgi:hypothetical protein
VPIKSGSADKADNKSEPATCCRSVAPHTRGSGSGLTTADHAMRKRDGLFLTALNRLKRAESRAKISASRYRPKVTYNIFSRR